MGKTTMKNRLLLPLLAALSVPVVLYGAIGLCTLQWDITEWSEAARAGAVVWSLLGAFFAFGVVDEWNKKRKWK